MSCLEDMPIEWRAAGPRERIPEIADLSQRHQDLLAVSRRCLTGNTTIALHVPLRLPILVRNSIPSCRPRRSSRSAASGRSLLVIVVSQRKGIASEPDGQIGTVVTVARMHEMWDNSVHAERQPARAGLREGRSP
jgi:hypothetical protein